MTEVNSIFNNIQDDVQKHLSPAIRKIDFLQDKCTNKKLQENIRNKIHKEEWEHAVEAIDKQRNNLDYTYNELESMMKNMDQECETCLKKGQKKLFELVEGEFNDIDSLATKTRDKLIHLKSSKKNKVQEFADKLQQKRIRDHFKNSNVQVLTEASEEFGQTKTHRYGESMK